MSENGNDWMQTYRRVKELDYSVYRRVVEISHIPQLVHDKDPLSVSSRIEVAVMGLALELLERRK